MATINPHFQTLSEDQYSFLKTVEQEYTQGMLLLNNIDRSVTIYGGARIAENSEEYERIREIGQYFGKNDWWVITGGGPGAMTAALQGSREVGGKTAAFRINLQASEPQILVPDIDLLCTQFTTRKYMLRQADIFVIVPGGYGTLDELAELLNLIKTDKYPSKHVFLFGKKFWSGLVEWLTKTVSEENDLIPTEHLDIFSVIDHVDELAEIVQTHPRLSPILNDQLPGTK